MNHPDDAERPDLTGTKVGFVGLGLMGRPMARALADAGAALVAHNRSPGPVEELVRERSARGAGVGIGGSPAGVARATDVVVLMLTDTPAVDAVTRGPDGLLEVVGPDHLIIDMGTTAVADTRRLAALVAERGAEWVDAPVSGGTTAAAAASLTIMAGGSERAFARAMPLFRAMGRRITHVGAAGAGQVAKAANQVIVGLTIGAVAEALALARAAGVDPARVRDAIRGGFAESRVLELHGERMTTGNFAPGGRVATQLKDLRQALELAEASGLSLPAVALCAALYAELAAAGDGALDHAALYRLYDTAETTGRDVPPPSLPP